MSLLREKAAGRRTSSQVFPIMPSKTPRDLSLPVKNVIGGGLTTRAVTTVFDSRIYSAHGSNQEVIILAGPALRTSTALTQRETLKQGYAEGDFVNYQTLPPTAFGGARVLAVCWCSATPGNVLAEGLLAVSSSDKAVRFFAPDQSSPRKLHRLCGGQIPHWREIFASKTPSPCYALDFMFDGAFFAAGGAHLSVWKAQASSSAIQGFEGLRYVSAVSMPMEAEALALLAFAPDGRFIATSGLNAFTVSVWFEGTSIYGNMNCMDLAHPAPAVSLSWWHNELLRQRTDVLTPQKLSESTSNSVIPNVLMTLAQDGHVRLWQETDTSESLRFFVTAIIDASDCSPPTARLGRASKDNGPLMSAAWLNVHHPLSASDSAALPSVFGGKRGQLPAAAIMDIYSATTSSFPRHCHGSNAFFLDQADSRLGIKHDVIAGESGAVGHLGPSAIVVGTPANEMKVWVLTGLGAVPRTSLRVTLWGRANLTELKQWQNSKLDMKTGKVRTRPDSTNSLDSNGVALGSGAGHEFFLDTLPIASISRLSTLPSSLFAFQLAAATQQQPLGAVEQTTEILLVQQPVSRGCMPTLTTFTFDQNAPLTSNNSNGGYVRRALRKLMRRTMLPVAPGSGVGQFFAADSLSACAWGFSNGLCPQEGASIVNASATPTNHTSSRQHGGKNDFGVGCDAPENNGLSVQAMATSEDGQYLYIYWADESDLRASDAFAVASLLPGKHTIELATLVHSGSDVVVVALVLSPVAVGDAAKQNRVVLVGIDQQTCSWRFLADLAFKSGAGDATVEGAVDTEVSLATVGVHLREVDAGWSPNRGVDNTTGHRTLGASRAAQDAHSKGHLSLVYYVTAVARSGRRLLFWEVPFDLLRGLLRRFSGNTTIFLRGAVQTTLALPGDKLSHIQFVSTNPGSQDMSFAAYLEGHSPLDKAQRFRLRLLATSRKGTLVQNNIHVTTCMVGMEPASGSDDGSLSPKIEIPKIEVKELCKVPRIFAGSSSSDQPRVVVSSPAPSGDMVALVLATGPVYNSRFWLALAHIRIASLSQFESITPLPLPDRRAAKTGSSNATRALLKLPQQGGQLQFTLSWKCSGDGRNASGRRSNALAVAYADQLLVFSPTQRDGLTRASSDERDNDASVAVGSGRRLPQLSPVVRQTLSLPEPLRDSGTLHGEGLVASRAQDTHPPSAVSITGVAWLHRRSSSHLAVGSLNSEAALTDSSDRPTVLSRALVVSVAVHAGTDGKLQKSTFVVFDTCVAARSVAHMSPAPRQVQELPAGRTTVDFLSWNATKPLPHYHPDFILEHIHRHHTLLAGGSSSHSTSDLRPRGEGTDKVVAKLALESVSRIVSQRAAQAFADDDEDDDKHHKKKRVVTIRIPSLPISQLYESGDSSRTSEHAPTVPEPTTVSQDDRDDFLAEGTSHNGQSATNWDTLPALLDPSRSAPVGKQKSESSRLKIAGLSENEQRRLAAVAELWRSTLSKSALQGGNSPNLDDCGWRYYLAHRLREAMPEDLRPQALSTSDCAWALHCRDHAGLLDLVLPSSKDQRTWDTVRRFGPLLWLNTARADAQLTETLAMEVARAEYTRSGRDPYACVLFYVALGKYRQIAALIGANQKEGRDRDKDQRLAGFLCVDFSKEENRTKALKNAVVLVQQKRYMLAASFYIIAGQLTQAVSICFKNLHDYQLAVLVTAVNKDPSLRQQCLKELWKNRILSIANGADDCWLCSIARWHLGELRNAALTLFRTQTKQTAVPEPLQAQHHQFPQLTPRSADNSVVSYARLLLKHHKVLQEDVEAKDGESATPAARNPRINSARATTSSPAEASNSMLAGFGAKPKPAAPASSNDMFANFGAKPKPKPAAASASGDMFANFGAKPKPKPKPKPVASSPSGDMFANFGAKPKPKPKPAPAPAANDMFASFGAKPKPKPKPTPAPAPAATDMFASFGAKPKPKPSRPAASNDMFASFGAKPKPKPKSSTPAANDMFASFGAKPRAAAPKQPSSVAESSESPRASPLIAAWPPTIEALETQVAIAYRKKGFPLLAYFHFNITLSRRLREGHAQFADGPTDRSWLVAQLIGCVIDLLHVDLDVVETSLLGFGWSVRQSGDLESKVHDQDFVEDIRLLRARVTDTMSLLLGGLPGFIDKQAFGVEILANLDHICRNLRFTRSLSVLAGHNLGAGIPQSRSASHKLVFRSERFILYDALARLHDIIRLHPDVRHVDSVGLHKGCANGFESLDVWTIVQGLLDSAAVQHFATLSDGSALPHASSITSGRLETNLARVGLCVLAILRRDHSVLCEASFAGQPDPQSGPVPLTAAQLLSVLLQPYVSPDVVDRWVRVRDRACWQHVTKALDYDGLGTPSEKTAQDIRRMCATQIMEKLSFESLRLDFEKEVVAASVDPRPAGGLGDDLESRRIAAMQLSQSRSALLCQEDLIRLIDTTLTHLKDPPIGLFMEVLHALKSKQQTAILKQPVVFTAQDKKREDAIAAKSKSSAKSTSDLPEPSPHGRLWEACGGLRVLQSAEEAIRERRQLRERYGAPPRTGRHHSADAGQSAATGSPASSGVASGIPGIAVEIFRREKEEITSVIVDPTDGDTLVAAVNGSHRHFYMSASLKFRSRAAHGALIDDDPDSFYNALHQYVVGEVSISLWELFCVCSDMLF